MKQTQAVWRQLHHTRNLSDRYIANALAPVNELIERFIYRLHHESDDMFRVSHGTNFDKINRIKDHEIIKQADKLPSYYRRSGNKLKAIDNLDNEYKKLITKGYPDISENGLGPLNKGFKTFHDLAATELPAGTKLARVIDPKSADNSTCWMRIEEFEKLTSRAEWREKYAVLTGWNGNGEYITYTVPEGKTLKVWEGKAASQEIDETVYYIPGGAVQIVVDPKHLERSHISGRKPTNWGYGEINYQDNGITYLGVPDLTKNIGNWFKIKEE
ncbi:hypothetical protein O970_09020 [Candidatus Schmidhempelia bombi str. Bimp]|uniref:Uncharacterized protein n=1 Tax=Candidatus Schmidhempelia bombi str. Bimp TaxID=1387197 RepID=A0AB94IAG7_9GAMM|nr:hypothetical protein O970_09020 [Candidatus Schmidhempelia bombi str. Bimp]